MQLEASSVAATTTTGGGCDCGCGPLARLGAMGDQSLVLMGENFNGMWRMVIIAI
jgi:hypothetical protein